MSVVLCVFVIALVIAPTLARSEGDIARVVYWTAKEGAAQQLEEGLAGHNKLHADAGDSWAFMTGQVISGHHQGEYLRMTFGHEWADFDGEGEGMDEEADFADIQANIQPHIESSRTVFYRAIPEISHPAPGPMALNRVLHFHLKPGSWVAFEAAVAKVHAALQKQEDWPHYTWYAVVDGGPTPTYLAVLQRQNWAGFDPGDKDVGAAVRAEYGDDAPAVWNAVFENVAKQWSHTVAYLPELSYIPAPAE
jgi:hypothetical protein